ncbi:MAG: hypothetical protein M9897_06225 [Brumimicrobium sp.]|nr:hypothetical protein [Brumimicrobium sp.]
MKRVLILFIFIFLCNNLKAQVEVRPMVGVSEQFSMYNIITTLITDKIEEPIPRLQTFKKVGVLISTKKVNHLISGIYGFELIPGDWKYLSHLLGISYGTRFQKDKKFGFILSINGYSQIHNNYHLTFMRNEYDGSFIIKPQSYKLNLGSHGGPYITHYYSHFYISTPFVGGVLAGVDYKVFDGFHINLSVGFGMRIMKTKYAEWNEGDDYYKKLETTPEKTHYLSTMDFELGVSYAIPMKSGGGSKE